MIRVKPGLSQLTDLYIRIKKIIGGKVSLSFIKDILTLFYSLKDIQANSGNKGLVLYLKACAVCLQQAASGHLLSDMTPLKVRIKRTKGSKLPRIISPTHRRIIMTRTAGWNFIIKFYLTVFYMYRVIYFRPTESLKTIVNPGTEFDLSYFETYIGSFMNLFVKPGVLHHSPLSLMRK